MLDDFNVWCYIANILLYALYLIYFVFQKYIMESGIGKGLISRQGSILSLSGLSQASTSSFKVL